MHLKNIPARLAVAFAALVLAVCAAAPARAQEEAPAVVLDEPVAQVDNYVIMLSQLKRENAEFREVLTKQRGMTPEQADAEIQKRQPEIILNLINEALLVQKGKDTPRLPEEVEAEVNREVLRVAKSSNIPTIEELDEAMRREGMILADIKETLRRQFMRQAVLQREVDAKIYYGLTDKELRDYYNANRDKFVSVTLSELFPEPGRPHRGRGQGEGRRPRAAPAPARASRSWSRRTPSTSRPRSSRGCSPTPTARRAGSRSRSCRAASPTRSRT